MTLVMEAVADTWLDEWPRDMHALERALLRRGVQARDSTHERCARCHRTPLVGERVYLTDGGPLLCALCRNGQTQARLEPHIVRGPNSGRAIRVLEPSAA